MKLLAGGVLFIASLPSLLTHFSRVKHAVHTTGAVLITVRRSVLARISCVVSSYHFFVIAPTVQCWSFE